MQRALIAIPVFLLYLGACLSWADQGFDVRLNLNYESAERSIGLYEGLSGTGRDISRLKGSQIALATTADLARRHLTNDRLEASLDGIKFGQAEQDDVFGLREARKNVAQIKELLATIKRRNFSQKVAATVQQLFPIEASVSTSIPLYFVAFGHYNIDAYVRRVVWHGDTPRFVGEGEGELTIVVNLAKAVSYGRNVDERFIGVLSVVAHEVFHAAFGVFKDSSPVWEKYYERNATYLDQLLDLTHNEGIAHFLTFEQRTRGALPFDWDEKVAASFSEFNRSADELLSPQISPHRARHLIGTSNTSEYWKSYGAITGMFIARTIDQRLGRRALASTIAAGVGDFFHQYTILCERETDLPRLSASIARHVRPGR